MIWSNDNSHNSSKAEKTIMFDLAWEECLSPAKKNIVYSSFTYC